MPSGWETNGGASIAGNDDVIQVRGITKRFNGITVVDKVDLRVPRGMIFGFLGPNGSGKTTFLRMLCGLLRADDGEGTCLGLDIRSEAHRIKTQVGYMTQRFSFYDDLSVAENLDFVARMYRLPQRHKVVAESLERLGLRHRGQQLAGQLSGGWKQRLALAACMLHEPRLLLLDEPTAGVDPGARRDFWAELHELSRQGITVLVTTHYMDEAERCHALAYIAYGKLLIHGTAGEILAQVPLSTWRPLALHGHAPQALALKLQGLPGVAQVVPFGETLHVSGADAALLERSLKGLGVCDWAPHPTSLEDVFIYLMRGQQNGQPRPTHGAQP